MISSNSTENEEIDIRKSIVSDSILITISSLTIILAIICILLILIHRTFRTNKLNWFIINICCTTILLSAVMLSLTINTYMRSIDSFSCRAQAFLLIMAACQMMYSHSVISISRYLTIVHSNKRIFRSTVFISLCLISGWLTAFLLSIPYLFVDSFTCSISKQTDFLSYYSLVIVLFLPLLIILICNIRIFLFVRQSTRRIQAEGGRNNPSQSRDIRLIKTMIITFIVFVIGWIPLSIQQLFSETIHLSFTIISIFQTLPSFSMFFDVILLIYTNQPIRLFLYQLIIRRQEEQQIQMNTIEGKLS